MIEQNQFPQVGGNLSLPATFAFKPHLSLALEGQWRLPQIFQNVGTQVCSGNSRVRFRNNRHPYPKQEGRPGQANWEKRVCGPPRGNTWHRL